MTSARRPLRLSALSTQRGEDALYADSTVLMALDGVGEHGQASRVKADYLRAALRLSASVVAARADATGAAPCYPEQTSRSAFIIGDAVAACHRHPPQRSAVLPDPTRGRTNALVVALQGKSVCFTTVGDGQARWENSVRPVPGQHGPLCVILSLSLFFPRAACCAAAPESVPFAPPAQAMLLRWRGRGFEVVGSVGPVKQYNERGEETTLQLTLYHRRGDNEQLGEADHLQQEVRGGLISQAAAPACVFPVSPWRRTVFAT